ncbi:inter-alpha-trypsin inhibitor heavy chain H6 [Aplochiton taeniatus]
MLKMLKVTDYHVRCWVASRYALTTVESSVWNQLAHTKEAAFEVDLPSSAFISNFTITSNGKVYVAQVTERAAARKIYDTAKKQGKTAGLVATKEREIEKFRVAVSVPPGARFSFSLTYEELLIRRFGRYELTLGLRPGQLVDNLTLDVSITERTGISFLKVLPLKTTRLLSNTVQGDSDPPASTQVQQSFSCAWVHYSPSQLQQGGLAPKGLNADFIIQYGVELRDLVGDIQVYDGFFVHYFAPQGLPVVAKDVIFVIDVSGSMTGTKIKQTKQAMNIILGDLREGDHFNILTFSDKVHTWKKGRTVRATRQNVKDAKEFVKRIIADGWTNINAALLSAAQLVNPSPSSSSRSSSSSGGERRVPLVIFLTDGEATIGVTVGDTILDNAKKALGSASLFGLAFGDDADFPLLRRLALDNRGMARMVYEDADAALQLKGFYDEVASPLLSDVQLSYLDGRAFDVTRSLFPNYFQGSELVVAGKVNPGVTDLKVSVSAVDSKRKVTVENEVRVSDGNATATASQGCPGGFDGGADSFVRRLWAYFTIKELLQAKLNSTDTAMQRLLGEKATNLSLKYNFVTPVTSLVVVKPGADEPTTTAVPSTTATTTTSAGSTTTSTTVPPTALAPASKTAAKKPNSTSTRANRVKPGRHMAKPPTPQPPPARSSNNPQTKKSSPAPTTGKTTPPSSSRKTTTTFPPISVKTDPAPLAGKTPTQAPSAPKTAPAPPAGKISTFLSNFFKTVPPPGPGRVSNPQPITIKAVSSSTVKTPLTSTSSSPTPPPGSARTEPAPRLDRSLAPETNSLRTFLPTIRVPSLPSATENHTVGVKESHQPLVTTLIQGLFSPPTTTALTPAPAPALAPGDNEVDSDPEIRIATLVSANFAPMPGVTDGPKLWEAAGLLDVATSIQIQRKDFDATYDYEYDLNYDSWGQTADTESFVLGAEEECPFVECLILLDPPSRLSSARVFSSSVDGDPHFVLQLPRMHQNLCFTVDGKANDVLRLLEDAERGIRVDGHLVGAPSKGGIAERSRTYFDQLTISSTLGNPSGIVITLSLDTVVVEGEGVDTLPTNQQGSVARQGVKVAVDNHRSCWIELANDVRFLVLFHQYKHPSYLQMAHLGFYVMDGHGLSSVTQGLLGQFQHAGMTVTNVNHHPVAGAHQTSKEDILARGLLRWGSVQMPVMLQDKTLKDTVRKRHQGRCWVVPKADVERLLGHPYQSFVVAHW